MTDGDIAFAALDRAAAERFQSLRTPLGVSSFGINLMVLQPGQRGRIHAHERQEEVYLVLEGELTLLVEGVEHRLGADQLARVGPAARRQLVNSGAEPVVLLALGAAGDHAGRDALAWPAWEDGGPGAPPQEVPLPPDLPLA
ncbi:MAG: cupin domain-containing protein [Solirubrobacteraceae bacterium]|jgi:uncharacterized cupin superfamily protein